MSEPLRILSIGAGAIGTYIGGSLALGGNRVVFVERPEVAEGLRSRGLRLNLSGAENHLPDPQVVDSIEEALAIQDFDVALFDVSPEDVAGHYLGYSNSVLWPVLHGRVDLARFRASYFRRYRTLAARLARLLSAELRPDDRIWVHDYQLLPLAEELRKLGHGNAIGHFLHVPWAPYVSFSAIPEHGRIAAWLTQYDLVGLQTRRDVANLLDCLNGGAIVSEAAVEAVERLAAELNLSND